MSGDEKTMLKVQMEKELLVRIDDASNLEGLTRSAWVRKVLLQVLPLPAGGQTAMPQSNANMEAAYSALEAQEDDFNYPGVIPMPPTMTQPTPAPAPVMAEAAPKAVPQIQMSAIRGHSCIHLQPGGAANFQQNDVQGTCAAQGNRVCHWASHVAPQCPVFRPRMMRTPPMAPMR